MASFLVLFAFVYWTTTNALQTEAKDEVLEEVNAVISDYDPSAPVESLYDVRTELETPRGMRRYFVLMAADGHILAGNLSKLAPFTGWKVFPDVPGRIFPASDPEGYEHYLIGFGSRLSGGSWLVVGYDSYFVTEIQETIIMAFGWSAGVMLLLALIGGAFFSARLMRRIERFNATLYAVGQGQMNARVPCRDGGDEFDMLGTSINSMLDRIEVLLESLRQVTTDIAHDLRTPLSQLRQRLERAMRKPNNVEHYEEVTANAISSIDSILQTFEALLRIAQIEAGLRRSRFERVDLTSVCIGLASAYRAVAEDRAQIFSAEIDPDIYVEGDRHLLTQLGANLIENAIRHSPEGANINIALSREGAFVHLVVSDNGPGIPVEDHKNIFRRFFRLELSRTTAGSGLGMSLVKAVCDLHGADITLGDNAPGLRADVRFLFKA